MIFDCRNSHPTIGINSVKSLRLHAQRLNGSTAQRLNGSTAQRLNGSTAQRLNGSTAQRLNGSTAQPWLRAGVFQAGGGPVNPVKQAPRNYRVLLDLPQAIPSLSEVFARLLEALVGLSRQMATSPEGLLRSCREIAPGREAMIQARRGRVQPLEARSRRFGRREKPARQASQLRHGPGTGVEALLPPLQEHLPPSQHPLRAQKTRLQKLSRRLPELEAGQPQGPDAARP